ncbi:MAG: hypothetical protein ACTSPB_21135 [Candidatus Thorarchaeota archaeon]
MKTEKIRQLIREEYSKIKKEEKVRRIENKIYVTLILAFLFFFGAVGGSLTTLVYQAVQLITERLNTVVTPVELAGISGGITTIVMSYFACLWVKGEEESRRWEVEFFMAPWLRERDKK